MLGYQGFSGEVAARTASAADRLSSHIATRVSTWEYEDERMANIAREALRGGEYHVLRVVLVGRDGRVLFDVSEPAPPLPWLAADIGESVTDGRVAVARLRVTYSLYALVRPVQVAFLAGLVSMLALLAIGRMMVARALDTALHEVDSRGLQLSARVRELEATRQELSTQLAAREQDQRQLLRHAASLDMAGADFSHVAQVTTHHLQEPLRTVLSYSQLLLRWHAANGDEDDKAKEYVAFIRGAIHRMKTQLRALASYVSLRELDFSTTLLDLGVLMEEVAATERRMLQAAGASLDWGDLPVVVSNPDRLRTVLGSLIDNSLRWRRDDRPHHISVTAFSTGSHWVVRMSDDGRPLEDRDPQRLFHLLVHDEPGHVSVGLAPARLTVFLLGGALWAEEAPGGGTSFCFTLPDPEGVKTPGDGGFDLPPARLGPH